MALSYVGYSQINVQWESRYTSAGNNIDKAEDMVIDASGNIYVVGTSFILGEGFNLVTLKYDNAGNLLWSNTYDGPNNSIDEGRAIAIDASGNVFVTGYVHVAAADYEIITIKYDANGVLQWAEQFDNNNDFDQGRDIVVDQNGDVYVTGSGVQNSSNGNTNILTVKYANAGGSPIWSHEYNSASNGLDEGFKLTHDNSNTVYVAGYMEAGTNNLDMVMLKYDATSGGAPQFIYTYDGNGAFDKPTDIAVNSSGVYMIGGSYFNALQDENYATIKVNTSGVQQWVQTYNGSASDADRPNALVIDASDNIIVTGRSVGGISAEDYVTIMYDVNGNQVWLDRFTGSGAFYDEAKDVALDGTGNIYVTGYSYESATNNDFTTVKYDVAGNIIWSTSFNGPANNSDQALAMAVDAGDNIYVSGQSKGSGTGADISTIKYCQLTTDAGLDTSICSGDAVQLNATGASNFTWSVHSGDPISVGNNFSCNGCSNPVASPNVTTEYVVSSQNANGCVDYDTVVVVVNPLPGPVISAVGPTSFCLGENVQIFTTEAGSYTWNSGHSTDTITVDTSGVYNVSVIDSMGCINSSNSITVVVYSLPAIEAGSNQVICDGDSVQFLATGGLTFEWNNGNSLSDSTIHNPYAMPATDTWYHVDAWDGNGCYGYDSVMVTVNPLPAMPVITNVFAAAQLICNETSGLQWYLNDTLLTGETNQAITYSQNGDYTVTFTDANGCTSISNISTVVDVSVEELRGIVSLNIFPNPSNGILNLNIVSKENTIINVSVIDLQGREVFSHNGLDVLGELNKELDLNHLTKGLYSLVIKDRSGLTSTKLIIE